MTVCRRINYFPPKVVTLTVYICCEPHSLPKFKKWDLFDEGEFNDVPIAKKPPKNGLKEELINIEVEKVTKKKKKLVAKKKVDGKKEQEQYIPHISALEEQIVDVSFGVTNTQNKTNYVNSEVVFRSGNYCSGVVQIKSIEEQKKVKNKAKSPPLPPQPVKQKIRKTPPRYRVIELQESTINVFIEMEKQNVGEFVWDQNSTRIDALVVPIPELDRTTTPEIPIHVPILP